MEAVDFSKLGYNKYTSLLDIQKAVINAQQQVAKPEDSATPTQTNYEELDGWILNAAGFITTAAQKAEAALHEHSKESDSEDINHVEDDAEAFRKILESLCNGKGQNSDGGKDTSKSFAETFECTRSVIVYFVPGREPMAAFINWEQGQEKILKRIAKLNTSLNRRQFNVIEHKFDHLFEFSHAVFQDAITAKDPRTFLIPEIVPKGASGNEDSVVHEWRKYRWELDNSLQTEFKGEMLLVTGVVTTKDSLVIQATYYKKDFLKSQFKVEEQQKSDKVLVYSAMRHLHEMFGREVLSRFYAPLIQFNTKTLRTALQRTNVSRSFLEQAGRRLADCKDNFTYLFEHKGKTRCCADLYEIIFCDIVSKMETIFETIIKIEEGIYNDLWDGLRTHQKTLWPKDDRALWQFPERLEMTKLVQEVEYAQRAREMTTRDHVIHPFQTFLLGTLIINNYQCEFLKAIASDFGVKAEEIYTSNGDKQSELSNKGKALQTFLKASWFVCSTMHDIGYPIEVFDKLSGALRTQIGDLLNLDEGLLSQPGRLRIDQVMYDDPRTAIVLRRLVNGLYGEIEMPEKFKKQFEDEFLKKSLYWVVSRFAFVDKRHDIASTFALALMFLKCGDPSHAVLNELTKEFNKEEGLSPVEKHVFLPVMLHHVLEWSERIGQLKPSSYTTKSHENVYKNAAASEMLGPLFSLFGGCRSCRQGVFGHGLIKFERLPLAVLLTICDLFQEWGRPGGKAKKYFPNRIDGRMSFIWDLLPTLKVKLNYNNRKNSLNLKRADYGDRKPRVEKIDHIYDRGPLKDMRAEFSCDIGVKPISLERTDWAVDRIIKQCLDIFRKNVERYPRELAYLIRTCLDGAGLSCHRSLATLLSASRVEAGASNGQAKESRNKSVDSGDLGTTEEQHQKVTEIILNRLSEFTPREELEAAWQFMVNECYKGVDDKTRYPRWSVAKATEMAAREKSEKENRVEDESKLIRLWGGPFESLRYTAYFLPALKLVGKKEKILSDCTDGLVKALRDTKGKGFFIREEAPVWCVSDTVLSLLESGVRNQIELLKESVVWSLNYIEQDSKTQGKCFKEAALGRGVKPKPVEDATAILFAAIAQTQVSEEKQTEFQMIGQYLVERLPKVPWKERKKKDVHLRSACRIVWACSFVPDVFKNVENTYKELRNSVRDNWPEWIDNDELERLLAFCECLYLLVATERQANKES